MRSMTEFQYRGELFDMHCHAGFYPNPINQITQAKELGLSGFINTVTPQEYEQLKAVEPQIPCQFKVGVGFHPWWMEGRDASEIWKDVAQVCDQISGSSFIGEIGLDNNPRPSKTFVLQQKAFGKIMEAAAQKEQALISLHSSKAAKETIQILEETGILSNPEIKVIFHWFNGGGNELMQLLNTGCYVSVNKLMLKTKRGRSYAKQIPAHRILLESDLPANEKDNFSVYEWRAVLEETLKLLSEIREVEMSYLGKVINETSQELLEIR